MLASGRNRWTTEKSSLLMLMISATSRRAVGLSRPIAIIGGSRADRQQCSKLDTGTIFAVQRSACSNRVYRRGRRFLDNRAEEYRRLARECLRLVPTVTREDSGRLLIEMARVWIRLATEQETPLNPRIADTSRPAVQQQQPQLRKGRE